MKSLSYEDIPDLSYDSFIIVLRSMLDVANLEQDFLNASINDIDILTDLNWIDLGLEQEMLDSIVEQCCILFCFDIEPVSLNSKISDFAALMLNMWQQGQSTLRFRTYGSDGEVKVDIHSINHFRQEVASIFNLFEDIQSIIVTVPLVNVYGFTYGLLLPQALKIPIRFIPPSYDTVTAQIKPYDMVVGIPFLWANMAKQLVADEADLIGKHVTILTSTSAIPAYLLHLLCRYGFKTIEIFGSTRTAGCAFRTDPDEAYTLFPYLSRSNDSLLKLEYEHPNGSKSDLMLLDTVYWVDERNLRPIARMDKSVQVGGHSVYPEHVAEIIGKHPDVKVCLVRLMTPDEGFKLKAFIVPYDDVNVKKLHADLVVFLCDKLDDYNFPGSFTFGYNVPVVTFGRPSNW